PRQARRGDEASALPLAGGDVPRHAIAAGGALRGGGAARQRRARRRAATWQPERTGGVRGAVLRAALGSGSSRRDRYAAARLRGSARLAAGVGRGARASSRAARTSRRGAGALRAGVRALHDAAS